MKHLSPLPLLPLLALACSSSHASLEESAPTTLVPVATENVEVAGVQRVGGDMEARIELLVGQGVDGADAYRWGPCSVTTALPQGYPPPTPPGAFEIKSYPRARRAEVKGDSNPNFGMFFGFWPLFQHIKRKEIAMTSPVEMDYDGFDNRGRLSTVGWTMSFLYREPSMGSLGNDGDVAVEDREPVVVLSKGCKGPYLFERADETARELAAWLATNDTWESAGAPRGLFYNGPDQSNDDKWSEIQVPVRRRAK
ncbi:MAG: heme-binding protein [Planctomycetota bacterium]|nr:heme-binding protein [Planctomycetota bacterium]